MTLTRRDLMRALRRTRQDPYLPYGEIDAARDELLQRWLWRAETGVTYLTAEEIERTFDQEWPGMKLLVATTTGWSPATDPARHVIPGELLLPADICDAWHCLCKREFIGVTTLDRTLHAQVAELDIDHDQLHAIARGYVRELHGEDDADETDAYMRDLTDPAEQWPVGTVIERWGYELRDLADNTMHDDGD